MGLFNKGVGLLANLKIRKKLLVALLPLALMVIAATLYSSTEMIRIDRWYSELIDRDVQALQNLTDARAKTTQFGELLYKEIAEPDPDRMRVIDAALDQTVADYHAYEVEARQESPAMAPQIASAGALFDQAWNVLGGGGIFVLPIGSEWAAISVGTSTINGQIACRNAAGVDPSISSYSCQWAD